MAANGAGKTTCLTSTSIMSLIAAGEDRPALLVMDHKEELAAQFVPMLDTLGVPHATIDDMGRLPADFSGRVSLNPLSAVVETFESAPQDTVFAMQGFTKSLIPEPADGETRNLYFRDHPRWNIEVAANTLLRRNPALATPGGIASLLSDINMFRKFVAIEAEEADGYQRALARTVQGMIGHEHEMQHMGAAIGALSIFGNGTRLGQAGIGATTNHSQLVRDRKVIFLVGSMTHMNSLGPFYAMHLMVFLQALYLGAGKLTILNEEMSNAPLKPFIDALTTIRAFGRESHNIAQSRSEIAKKFGDHAVDTIEENAIVKQWFGFSGFKEAKLVSEMMGEQYAVQASLGTDSESLRLSTNTQLIKQRWMSPSELMAMPSHQQLVHVKGLGFFVADKIGQHNIAPHCDLIAPNPLEGGRIPPDPKITLTLPEEAR